MNDISLSTLRLASMFLALSAYTTSVVGSAANSSKDVSEDSSTLPNEARTCLYDWTLSPSGSLPASSLLSARRSVYVSSNASWLTGIPCLSNS